jgi:hypothetical protein
MITHALFLLLSCQPAELSLPDPNRCLWAEGDELWQCCANAGMRDCQRGFIPPQALYGPEGQEGQPAEAYDVFYRRCQYEYGAASYCYGYCQTCPDYLLDVERTSEWAGEETDRLLVQERDCVCN